ncbi:MAG: hypothetical protein K8F27_08685 [Sulfuricellaceae bacterium]|nr:hypothetical protein [Sulfuricellaceae bacterium]
MKKLAIRVGGTYSNGVFGRHWSVRQVLAEMAECDSEGGEALEDCIVFKVLVGQQRRKKLVCSRSEFLRWASYEVERDETSWIRRGTDAPEAL